MAHPELDALLNTLLPFAQKMLSEYGEFHPFGATMSSHGEIQLVGGKVEGDDHPPAQDLIDLLTETFKREAAEGRLRAAGICYDSLTIPPGETQKKDAVCCALEHCVAGTVNVFIPYVKGTGGAVRFGEIFAAKRIPQFFCDLPQM
jgi:hypothetical protein